MAENVKAEGGQIACPKCGKFLSSQEESQRHDCVPTPTLSMDQGKPLLQQLTEVSEDLPRVVPCPHCKESLDVASFDPLDTVQCPFCGKSFTLLKSFAGYTLLRSYDKGWHHAIFLGRKDREGSAIIKVLSSRVLSQPNCMQEFHQEAERIRSGFQDSYADQILTGVDHGFQYFIVPLASDMSEDQIMLTAGLSPGTGEVLENQGGKSFRKVTCSRCQSEVDVTASDPLDHVECMECGDSFELMRRLGDYVIDYRLNSGGSSLLYLAQAPKLKKDVALKVLNSQEIQRGADAVRQFVQECELTRKLVHPNLIQVYDHGNIDGFYYMALELVEGLTLDDILKKAQGGTMGAAQKDPIYRREDELSKGGLPELIALEIILQAAAGLGVAHELDLVHGDVKPNNIMVTYEGMVKVLDFGLVSFANVDKIFSMGEGDPVYGTPLYIPPERVRREPEDFRSDFYGLGATLYHLLRGVPPFTGTSPLEIAMKQMSMPNLSFKAFAPWVSDTTCRIINKSLKKKVEDRYSTHLEFIADLILAKNQILNDMPVKKVDGRTLLKSFMRYIPRTESSRVWRRAETNAVRTYKYVTKAITQFNIIPRVKKVKDSRKIDS